MQCDVFFILIKIGHSEMKYNIARLLNVIEIEISIDPLWVYRAEDL